MYDEPSKSQYNRPIKCPASGYSSASGCGITVGGETGRPVVSERAAPELPCVWRLCCWFSGPCVLPNTGLNEPLLRSTSGVGVIQANAPGVVQPLPQFAARASHTGLHRAGGDLQNLGGLASGELLNRPQQKSHAISGPQSFHRALEQFSQLFSGVSCLWTFYGRLEVLGSGVFLGRLDCLFQRQIEGAAPLAQTHQRLINGDSRNPGGQARTTFELAKLAMHFEQRLLLHIFSVLSIARNAQSQAIYPTL